MLVQRVEPVTLRLISEDLSGRRIWLGHVPRFDHLTGLASWPQQHFILFLAVDPAAAPGENRSQVAQHLIRAGAVYICTWGVAAAELEEEFDYAGILLAEGNAAEPVLMTTSHPEETLDEALWFAVHSTWPDSAYESSCGDLVAVAVGPAEWEHRMESYLRVGAPA